MNEIVTTQADNYLTPVVNVSTALTRYQTMKDFIDKVLNLNIDYGTIPGTNTKPVLLKPGAEKLAAFFGLAVTYEIIEKITDWTGHEHGEPFFYYHYKTKLLRQGLVAGEGEGSCNSWETKYRYRSADRVCPGCGATAIIKGKAEYGGGWICFNKKGGCGAKYKEDDPAITSQPTGKVPNPDVADVVNTVQKMAQKRSLVAAVLNATNASDWFTQDVEDYVTDATFTDVTTTGAKPVVMKPRQDEPAKQEAKTGNKRPLAPDKLKAYMAKKAEGATPATDEVISEVVAALTGFVKPESITAVVKFLYGAKSLDDLTPEQFSALHAWLGMKDGIIDPLALDEIGSIISNPF